ncbi:hypothetical protein C8R44DRAFT_741961 [Mycena epipterygia]|nr:hypothetical protein C8R44DRAFT_741961 [Mycena epipterygia]
MDWQNHKAHITGSKKHKQAVEHDTAQRINVARLRQNQQDDLARQREAATQFSALQEVQIPAQDRTAYRVQSAAETELWQEISADPQGAGFDLGFTDAQHQSDTLLGLWNAETMGHSSGPDDRPTVLDEDDTDEFLAEIMQNAAIGDPQTDDILNFESTNQEKKSEEWSPYPSKMLFLLDTLDNLPRLRISNSLMKVFLWILKEAGAGDIPSFDHLRKTQKSLRRKCGVPTTQYKTAKGNIFHMNDPRTLISKDWANPETRKFIRVYPEIPEDGVVREIWHAQKWRKDMDLENLSPMYAAQYSHFYVNELARLRTGKLVIPIRWIKFKNLGVATVLDMTTILISASDLTSNFLDLEDEMNVPTWADHTVAKGYPGRMPNPKRALAQGDRLYSSFIDYFGDDVSGNRSKSWNKHWNAYMTHRNLLRELLQQEFHVHFVSTSPNASITEQFTVFKSVIELTHKEPLKVHDAETQETTRLSIYGNAGPSDNPMQSEITGHIGAKGNYMCRKCKAVKLACSGVAQPIKNSQTATGVKDAYTQHWIDHLLAQFTARSNNEIQEELIQWTLDNEEKIYSGFLTLKGFDPTKDTPVEILHTILLGVVKYIWHSSHTSWNASQKETFIINTHAFHNTHLLRQALPRHLTVPLPLFVDRKAKHFELAVTLRETKQGKRQRAKEKREAKKKEAEANQATNTTAQKTRKKRKAAHQQTVNTLQKASEDGEDDDQPEKSGADDSDSEDSDSDGERPNKRPRTKTPGDDSDLDSNSDSDYQAVVQHNIRHSTGMEHHPSCPLEVFLSCFGPIPDPVGLALVAQNDSITAVVHGFFAAIGPAFGRVESFTAVCRNGMGGALIHDYVASMDCRRLVTIWLGLRYAPPAHQHNGITFSSALPALRNLRTSGHMPPHLHQVLCERMTVLELSGITGVMRPDWAELGAFLGALPNLRTIRLAGVSCHGRPSETDSLLFKQLTHIEIALYDRSMVDVLSTFIAPALHCLRLDITPTCALRYLLSVCARLMHGVQTLDLKVLASLHTQVFIDLYEAVSSATTLDFHRTPVFRTEQIAMSLMNGMQRLPLVKRIILAGPVDDNDASCILGDGPDGRRLHDDCKLIAPLTIQGAGRIVADGRTTRNNNATSDIKYDEIYKITPVKANVSAQ